MPEGPNGYSASSQSVGHRDFLGRSMDFIQRQTGDHFATSLPLNSRELISTAKPLQTYKVYDIHREDTSDSVVKILKPVFVLARIIGIPFQTRFRWLSFRTLWLVLFVTISITITLLNIEKHVPKLTPASFGAILFYFLGTTYLIFLLWFFVCWPALRDEWLKLEEMMVGLPKVRAIALVTTITTVYCIFGLSEHFLSILDNVRRLTKSCGKNDALTRLQTMALYYKGHYPEIFTLTEFAIWKGLFTSFYILMITVTWTFADVFLMTLSLALSSRIYQLDLALRETKGKLVHLESWKRIREIYVGLSELVRRVDDNISFLLMLSLGNNVYSVCIMLGNALSIKTNLDFLQVAYYVVSFAFVFMRLAGICICCSRVNDYSKNLLPMVNAVPSSSYSIEVQRLLMQIWYDPLALTAFKFFAITRSTVLKIIGTILTYEIVLVQQFKVVNADEDERRPLVNCDFSKSNDF